MPCNSVTVVRVFNIQLVNLLELSLKQTVLRLYYFLNNVESFFNLF